MLEDTVHYLTDLGLEHANEYFTQVRITDNAGNESVVFSSDGVLVDLEPPIPGAVVDGLESDEEFTSSLSTLNVSWKEFRDDVSGIESNRTPTSKKKVRRNFGHGPETYMYK